MKKKKIGLFLYPKPTAGGTFQYNQAVLEAATSLPKERFELIVIYTEPLWEQYLQEYSLDSSYIPLGFWGRAIGRIWRKAHLPMSWWRNVSSLIHPVAKALEGAKCDLWIFPSQDLYSFQAKVPALSTIHDLMHRYESGFPEVADKGQYAFREMLYSNMCKYARGILVDSEVGKKQVHDSYDIPLERVFVLPFIPPKYIFENKTSPDFEKKYKLPPKYIFYPAQFWEHKNHLNLVKAVYLLKKEFKDIHLVLVGSAKNAYETVRNLVSSTGLEQNVSFFGYVPDEDMPEFYRRARALVMPTYFGPTNIPQLEAFVLSCPVATSDIYGIPEQVGDAALLFNPESVQDIAECIQKLWSDDKLCNNLIEKGKNRAAAWGQKEFNQRLLEIIDKLV